MGRFSKLYPFTTENLNYLNHLNLNNKKVITITGSGDHVINLMLAGSKDITAFDINKKTKYYTKLKLLLIKYLNYDCYLRILGLTNNKISLINNPLFYRKYFDRNRIIKQNPYLKKDNYLKLKKLIKKCKIRYLNISFQELEINEEYDYMFLSNISDYINMMYERNSLEKYLVKIKSLNKKISKIYFTYLYGIDSIIKRTEIDNISNIKKYIKEFKIEKLKTALINTDNKLDAVLILERRK